MPAAAVNRVVSSARRKAWNTVSQDDINPRPEDSELAIRLAAAFDCEAYPAGEDSLAYCLVSLQVSAGEEALAAGEDADICLVLDVSGSMDKPNRYPLLREAVRRMIADLAPADRISITVFSDRAETVVPLVLGADAADGESDLLLCMDRSNLLFGPRTLLAPGLRLALDELDRHRRSTDRVRRLYVLTDGELHDAEACLNVLALTRPRRAEVHVFGFGDEFDAAALKRLVSDQLGGTVKPICNEQDILRTFAHVARVNRRLIGRDGTVKVAFRPQVVCGDGWMFQPKSRYLGPIGGAGRFEHTFGALEAGRIYSWLVELRLPADEEQAALTPVASAEAIWIQGDKTASCHSEFNAPRVSRATSEEPPAVAASVKRAYDVLNALRNREDIDLELASLRARRELAVLERRDPNLIAALDKMIEGLSGAAKGTTVEQAKAKLSPAEGLYLDSDQSTVFYD
jgi:hypothetical protein